MEKGWETIKIRPMDVARAVGDVVLGFMSFPESGYPSEYPKHPERRGAAAMLDAALDQPPVGATIE